MFKERELISHAGLFPGGNLSHGVFGHTVPTVLPWKMKTRNHYVNVFVPGGM